MHNVKPTRFDYDAAGKIISLAAQNLSDPDADVLKGVIAAYERKETIALADLSKAQELFAFYRADGRH